MSARAYLGQLLVCHTDAALGVLSNQRLSLRGGGTDSSETDDDRSALPLMCTYLPIGELCHSRDLCLNSPHTPRLPSPPALLVPAPCRFCRAALCMWRQSQAPLSPASTQSGFARSNAGFIFRKSLRVSSILIDSAVTFPMEDYTVYL